MKPYPVLFQDHARIGFGPTGLPQTVAQYSTNDPAGFGEGTVLWTADCAFRAFDSFVFPGVRLSVHRDRARDRIDVNLMIVERAWPADRALLGGDPGPVEVPHRALVTGPRVRPIEYFVAVPGEEIRAGLEELIHVVPSAATDAVVARNTNRKLAARIRS